MIVEKIDNVIIDLDKDDLFNYLSEIIFVKTDEEIDQLTNMIDNGKNKLSEIDKEINEIKSEYELNLMELSKQQTLMRILSLIESLKMEGRLVGQRAIKIRNLLNVIDEKSFDDLREIETKLSILREK